MTNTSTEYVLYYSEIYYRDDAFGRPEERHSEPFEVERFSTLEDLQSYKGRSYLTRSNVVWTVTKETTTRELLSVA